MVPPLIPIIWSMIAGACLATGAMHFGTWLKPPRRDADLAFAVLAWSIMCQSIFELLLMRAVTPEEFGLIQRWMHVPLFMIVVSMVAFVRIYFRAGPLWLAWLVCVLRLASLAANFLFGANVEYQSITRLLQVELLDGEMVSVAVGIYNPWAVLSESSAVLLAAFVLSATIERWRQGGRESRRSALVVGGSVLLMLAVAMVNTCLLHRGFIHSIYLYALPFSFVLAAIGSEMTAELARSERLAGQLYRSESELFESERRMDLAAEAARIGTWEWDIVRDEVWMNPQGRILFGFDPDEPLNFGSFLDALCPDDREAARNAVLNSRLQGGTFERDYRVCMPGGGLRWIHTRGGVDMDAGGKAVRLRGVSFDVTALKEAQERFRSVVEAAANGLIMLDVRGRIALVNPGAEAIFGYSRQELVGQSIEALVPEAHRASHVLARESFMAQPTTRDAVGREVQGRRKDGSVVTLEIGLTPIHASEGIAVLVSIVDISERKRLDAEVKKERAFLRQVIDIDPNLIFAKDRLGRFTLANQAVAHVYGTTVEDLIGRTDADFNPNAEEVEAFRRADLQVMDTLQELVIPEEHITDASGRDICVQTVKRPILDEDGTANQVLGVATDITARKQAELEMGRQRNELAHLSRVTMVSELSGSIAHELNQPLTAILSNAQAALRFMSDAEPNIQEVREILRDIVNDDKRAGEVIQGLRLLLKKGEMRRAPIDMNEVVHDVLRLLRSDLLDLGIVIRTHIAEGLPRVPGDRVQLQQVVLNLIVNGCDAMAGVAARDRALAVSAEATDAQSIRVCVTDQGPGIPHKDVERVFEAFFTTKSHGLGLGLAICRSIVEAHGGKLWAERNEIRGMTFCFTLPTTREEAP